MVIADKDGSPILLVGVSTSPPSIDANLLPSIGLSADQTPICGWAPSFDPPVRVHPTTGGADCALDSGTRRCCTMLGGSMKVEVPAAVLKSNQAPPVYQCRAAARRAVRLRSVTGLGSASRWLRARWIEGRLARLLPVHYFHVVFMHDRAAQRPGGG